MKDAKQKIQAAYELAKERFAEIGVDTEKALQTLNEIPISIQCWQGDDVRGFENPDGNLTGGIQTTGNYPGRARTANELRADLDVALAQIPGSKRLNLHAIYLESATPVGRDAIEPKHFEGWVKWAKANHLGLDFNPTCFSHPLSERATLSHPDAAVRKFDALSGWFDAFCAGRKDSDKATIKKIASNEANVSQRTIHYDLYVDGKYEKTFKDINDAMDARDKINKGTK